MRKTDVMVRRCLVNDTAAGSGGGCGVDGGSGGGLLHYMKMVLNY